MYRPKEIKNPRIIKTIKELENLEDTIEEITKIEESETEIIIQSTKRKLNAIEKEKIIKMNELEEDLRTETIYRRTKMKRMSFKTKNKKIARKKIESVIE